ncbi:MAG: 2-amino-4-hydroxy-6-hydroxymethyldihydropteridine diphosphokinase [Verrucomicrobia bacterium]|nr:2-amino-4-hydroxy-6-hydroxymethyldihydropteridine diphosphokinase [Verrucomicrobiota bacterium]
MFTNAQSKPCGIALGSNLGNRLQNLRNGFWEVARLRVPGTEPLVSSIYETEPVDCESGTPYYLNAVVQIEYENKPEDLITTLIEVELRLGRSFPRKKNQLRSIDLDLLYAGQLTIAKSFLTVPHPKLHQRRFVLAPLAEIAPDLVVPGQKLSTVDLLARLPAGNEVKKINDSLLTRDDDPIDFRSKG